LIEFLKARVAERSDSQGAYVINLSAGWGAGKTFFLRKMKEQLELTGHLVSYIDAWKDDDAAEPMVAVMAAMNETLKPHLATRTVLEKTWNVAKSATGTALALTAQGVVYQLAKKALGPAIDGLADLGAEVDEELAEKAFVEGAGDSIAALTNNYMQKRIDAYQAHQGATDRFKKSVAGILKILETTAQKQPPYFVLIDELDRCRPTYAVEMLEQVKHLFDVPGLCFVVATDGEQLAHSVSAVYGASFDGAGYLRRFFNRRYRFKEPDIASLVRHLIAKSGLPEGMALTMHGADSVDFLANAFQSHDLTLRDIDQVFDTLRSFITSWNSPVPVELAYLIPLIVYNHLGKTKEFDELSRGVTESLTTRWMVAKPGFDRASGRHFSKIVTVKDELSDLHPAFLKSTDQLLLDNTSAVSADTWLGQTIRREHEQRFGSRAIDRNDPRRVTLMKQYAGRVRNLARLDRYEDEEEAQMTAPPAP
jgi:hypothetical protein